jgi:DNA uptake protein ComE-like DNA-binding protein
MVLVLCRSMRVEALAAANGASATQASSVERGAEQYVLAMIAQEGDGVRDVSEDLFAQVPVGNGVFWILRPSYDDDTGAAPVFGLVEESGKLNLNTATFDQLDRLPGMTYTAASSIMDWKDSNSDVERDGAESDYYLSLPDPYYCKNSSFETVEELLLVRGVFREMLYGDGTAPPLGNPAGSFTAPSGSSLLNDPQIARGWYDLLTVYSSEPNTNADGQPRINVAKNNKRMRQALYTRLQSRLEQKRAAEFITAIGGKNMHDVFEFFDRAKLKPDEIDLIADDVTTTSGNTLRGRINVNSAPRAVLETLDGLEDADVEKLVAARASASNSTSIGWVAEALGKKAASAQLGTQITTRTYQYSADILAATDDGRAFKRVRIVVNNRSGTPQIIYRRDITDRGWPMDASVLTALRNGQLAMNATAMGLGGYGSTGAGGMGAGAGARGGMQ